MKIKKDQPSYKATLEIVEIDNNLLGLAQIDDEFDQEISSEKIIEAPQAVKIDDTSFMTDLSMRDYQSSYPDYAGAKHD